MCLSYCSGFLLYVPWKTQGRAQLESDTRRRGGVKLGSIFNPMIKVPVLKGIYLISQARERLEMFLQHFVFAEVTRKEQLQIMLLER